LQPCLLSNNLPGTFKDKEFLNISSIKCLKSEIWLKYIEKINKDGFHPDLVVISGDREKNFQKKLK